MTGRDGGKVENRQQWHAAYLEHDPEKWKPVLGKDHAQTDS
jgi:hypothetical protein